MGERHFSIFRTSLVFLLFLIPSHRFLGQTATLRRRISETIDEKSLVTLGGNTHPLARPEWDKGIAPDQFSMPRMLLVLRRGEEQENALKQMLVDQQVKSSPSYHQWLTPQQFGTQFGPGDEDIQTVSEWLTNEGFQVNRIAAGRSIIEFSGTAGQVRHSFHTEIHNFVRAGESHWANQTDPQIPAALAPVVAGIVS
ncbi:MAG: protease pro-enzyme activation domain-containing protein, partial [Terriglobia bacterium]